MTLTPTTRASLLLRLCDSEDHEAWVEFVTLYEPVIYRLLRRHGLQDADARDVMQELLLAVSRSIDRWEPSKESRLISRLVAAGGSQSGHQLAEAARAARGGRQAVPTCNRCSTCCPPPTSRIRSSSTVNCVVPCFIGRANECGAKSTRQPGKRFGKPPSSERRRQTPRRNSG